MLIKSLSELNPVSYWLLHWVGLPVLYCKAEKSVDVCELNLITVHLILYM